MDFDFKKWWDELDFKSLFGMIDKEKASKSIASGLQELLIDGIFGPFSKLIKDLKNGFLKDEVTAPLERGLATVQQGTASATSRIGDAVLDAANRAANNNTARPTDTATPTAPAGTKPAAQPGRTVAP